MLDKNVNLNGKTVLVTGAAGFIGSNLCKKLLTEYNCAEVVGLGLPERFDATSFAAALRDA